MHTTTAHRRAPSTPRARPATPWAAAVDRVCARLASRRPIRGWRLPSAFAIVAVYLYLPPRLALAVDGSGDGLLAGLFVLEGLLALLAWGLVRARGRQPTVDDPATRLAAFLHRAESVRRGSLADDDPPVEALTRREQEVARQLAFGMSNDEIAAALFVSRNTVKTHLKHIYEKLGVGTRTEAVARCIGLGLLDGLPGDNELRRRVVGSEETLPPERPAA